MAAYAIPPSSPPNRRRRGGILGFSGGLNSLREAIRPPPPPIDTNITAPAERSALTMENAERAMEITTRREVMSQIAQTQADIGRQMNAYTSMASIGQPIHANSTDPLSSLLISKEEAMESFPPDKDWKKIYKSKKPIEEKVAHILIQSSRKVEEVKKTLEETESRDRDVRRGMRAVKKEIIMRTQEIRELKKKKRELELETKEEKEQRAHNVILDVLKVPGIENIEVDEEKRIFITTNEIMITKEYWKEPRNAGQYQILIDFYQARHSIVRNGVRVLNITKRFLEYDHPCIKDTHCCWGTIEQDIVKDYKDRDLLELVVDLLLYISSPNDDSGWITYSKKPPTERHKQGWEQFLEFAKPMPKNFSFLKYEKQKKEGIESGDGFSIPDAYISNLQYTGTPSTITPMPPEPARLPPLSVNSEDFDTSFARIVRELIEVISREDINVISGLISVFAHRLRNSPMMFIKRIEVVSSGELQILGWAPSGERVEMLRLPDEIIRLRRGRQQIVRFSDPPWFNPRFQSISPNDMWGNQAITVEEGLPNYSALLYGGGGGGVSAPDGTGGGNGGASQLSITAPRSRRSNRVGL